jgi:hypothetical protein
VTLGAHFAHCQDDVCEHQERQDPLDAPQTFQTIRRYA